MTIKFLTIQFYIYIHTQLIWTWLGDDITKNSLKWIHLVWIWYGFIHFISFFFLSEKQFINNIIFTKYKIYYLFNVEFA